MANYQHITKVMRLFVSLFDRKEGGMRRRMCMNNKRLVPKEYEVCEYIENTSTAYIDSGFIPNQDTRVIVKYRLREYRFVNEMGWLFGIRPTYNSYNKSFYFSPSSSKNTKQIVFSYSESYVNQEVGLSVGVDYVADFNKNKAYLNGTLLKTFNNKKFSAGKNLYVLGAKDFYYNPDGNILTFRYGVVYYCQIYDNGVLVRDYIPVRRKSDGKYGLFDKVNKTFNISPNGVDFSGK